MGWGLERGCDSSVYGSLGGGGSDENILKLTLMMVAQIYDLWKTQNLHFK